MSLFQRTKTISCLIGMSVIIAGCPNKQDVPNKPGFKDGAPPVPKTENSTALLPEPMGLNKGMAAAAIEDSILIAGDELNINEQLRLKTILTGYNGFDQYVFEAQIRPGGRIEKVYATTGYYNPSSNQFLIDGNNIKKETKKPTVI